MTVYPTLLVEAPPIQPYRYGLESVAVPAPTDDEHWAMGVEYEPIGTYLAQVWPGACYVGSTGNLDLPDGVGTMQALPFSVFSGVECKAIGYTEAQILARARAVLKLGWQYGAEQALWAGASGNTPFLTSAGTVVGSGGSVVDGIAALEDYLGSHYSGVGVIHVPRKGGAYLADRFQVSERGGQLQTTLGSQYVFGGGYPNTAPGGGAAGANNLWMYATGLITVRRAEAFINGGLAQALNRSTNVETVFAEQPTVLTIDGPIVAYRADLTK